MALAAERSTARHLDDIAAFWTEFICEEEPRKPSAQEFKPNKYCCQDPIYQEKAEIIFSQSERSMTKVNSVDFAIPDDLDHLPYRELRRDQFQYHPKDC